VKARRSAAAGLPEEAVGPAKARRLARLAGSWLARRGMPGAPREFWIVAVDLDAAGAARAVRLVPLEPGA
jgi:putative endonuclease